MMARWRELIAARRAESFSSDLVETVGVDAVVGSVVEAVVEEEEVTEAVAAAVVSLGRAAERRAASCCCWWWRPCIIVEKISMASHFLIVSLLRLLAPPDAFQSVPLWRFPFLSYIFSFFCNTEL